MIILLLLPFINIVHPHPSNPRAVNMEFQTIIDFNSYESHGNVTFLEFMKVVVEKLYDTLWSGVHKKEHIFRDHLRNLGAVLKKYNEDDIEFALDVAAEEIESYYSGSQKYNPLLFNPKLLMVVKSKLRHWKNNQVLKLKVTETLEKTNDTIVDAEFFSLLSQIFSMQDLAQFKGFLKNFDDFPNHKNKYKLYKTVKEALEYYIIKKYEELDDKAKESLDKAITELFGNKQNLTDFGVKISDIYSHINYRKGTEDSLEKTRFKAEDDRSHISLASTGHKTLSSCSMTTVTRKSRMNFAASNAELSKEKVSSKAKDLPATIFY